MNRSVTGELVVTLASGNPLAGRTPYDDEDDDDDALDIKMAYIIVA